MDPMVECISYSSIAYLQIGGHSINDCPLDDNVTLEVGILFHIYLNYIITFQLSHEN